MKKILIIAIVATGYLMNNGILHLSHPKRISGAVATNTLPAVYELHVPPPEGYVPYNGVITFIEIGKQQENCF
jgi:hypothetical protein